METPPPVDVNKLKSILTNAKKIMKVTDEKFSKGAPSGGRMSESYNNQTSIFINVLKKNKTKHNLLWLKQITLFVNFLNIKIDSLTLYKIVNQTFKNQLSHNSFRANQHKTQP